MKLILILFCLFFSLFNIFSNYAEASANLKEKLIKSIRKNPKDYDSFYLYNKELVKDNNWQLVDFYMNKHYPYIKNDYYKILFRDLYFKNHVNLMGDFFKANRKSYGESLSLDYTYRNANGNYFTLGFKNEERNFDTTLIKAKEYTLGYKTLLNRIYTYVATLSHSPEENFLATYSINQGLYFPTSQKTSLNISVKNSYFENRNKFNHSINFGFERYISNHILSANSSITLNPYKTLLSLTLAHIYFIDYHNQIRTHFSFGESLDDIDLHSGYKEFGLKYTYQAQIVSPSFFVNHYQSKYRLENKLGAQISWKF